MSKVVLPVCEICGAVMPNKKFKRHGVDCCVLCIDIYEKKCDTTPNTKQGESNDE